MTLDPCSPAGPFGAYRSMSRSMAPLGVAGALHRDGGRRGLDLVQVSGGELEVGGGEVLVESGELAGAGDRDDPWLMRAIADVEPWYLRAYSASTAGATSGCPAALTSIQVTSRATPGARIRPWCHQDLDRRAVVHRLVPGGNLVTVFSSSPPIRGSSPPTLQVTRSRPALAVTVVPGTERTPHRADRPPPGCATIRTGHTPTGTARRFTSAWPCGEGVQAHAPPKPALVSDFERPELRSA